jgi:signal transduction histidine kinase
VTSSPYRLPLALPRVTRTEDGRALGGVAAGIAKSLAVDPTLVRLTFALLALADGAGAAAYVGAWLALSPEEGPPPVRRRRVVGVVLIAFGGLLALRGFGVSDSLLWPLALGAAALMLIRSRSGPSIAVGVVLGIVAVVAFVDRNVGHAGTGAGLQSSAVAIALLLILGPWAWRLAVERDAERTARIRTEERAEMAARIHDSVLQTLALVQREAGDPKRVAALARRQERELRGWLYPGSRAEGASLASALETAAAEVEELHGIPVELVRTGDLPLDERTDSLALASREAMANAAEHSGAEEVAVFVDVGDDDVAVFVRDRGSGFDPESLPDGSHGIAESIRGRMERVGGTAALVSSPEGTEVELRLRRQS